MPSARIIASNPSAARYTARTLHEAGYEVEIVPPGTPADPAAEVVFDLDADKLLSISTDRYVPGEREFVLKPMWRRFTAKKKTEEAIARAVCKYPRRAASARTPEVVPAIEPVVASAAKPDREAVALSQAQQAAQASGIAEQRIAAEEKRRAEENERTRAEQLSTARAEEAERAHAEQLRIQQEQEAARRREIESQQAELRRQQQARELELARQREREERAMIVRKQEEERQRAEAMRREAEVKAAAESAYQQRLEEQRAEALRREALQRQADEAHRSDVLRQRQDEELERKAEAQRLLLVANMRREESARERETANVSANTSTNVSVPTLSQYIAMRLQQRSEARAAKSRAKVTRIDRGGRSAWRQAWPITAGVAALCLIGWGIASYRDAAPSASTQDKPPILAPGQIAPYPVAAGSASTSTTKQSIHRAKRSAVRNEGIAQDEVVVHHYYPSKATTAQAQPQRKKITDLQ